MDPNPGVFLAIFRTIEPYLWLTPLFSVDYTRSTAREVTAHLSVDHSGGNGRPGPTDGGRYEGRKDTRGRLGHNEPLESVGRVSLEERIDPWTGQGIAWCGIHVSPEILFPLEQSGQVMYWGAGCIWSPSEHCSAKYRTQGTTNHRSWRQAHSRVTQGEKRSWPRW
jgi:hypothetical protein